LNFIKLLTNPHKLLLLFQITFLFLICKYQLFIKNNLSAIWWTGRRCWFLWRRWGRGWGCSILRFIIIIFFSLSSFRASFLGFSFLAFVCILSLTLSFTFAFSLFCRLLTFRISYCCSLAFALSFAFSFTLAFSFFYWFFTFFGLLGSCLSFAFTFTLSILIAFAFPFPFLYLPVVLLVAAIFTLLAIITYRNIYSSFLKNNFDNF